MFIFKIKNLTILSAALVFLAGVVSAPVFAHDSEGNESSYSSADKSESSSAEHKRVDELSKRKMEKLRQEARSELDKKRRVSSVKMSSAERQKKCESRKNGMNKKIANLNKNASKHLAHFDTVYSRVLEYKNSKNLSSQNIESLVVSANDAQLKAAASVEALNQLKPTIACEKDSVPNDVAAFKQAAAQAREDLKSYKKAIKEVFKALRTARANDKAESSSGEGTGQ